MNGQNLHAHLDLGLQRTLPVGGGTAIFVYGACWHADGMTSDLEFELDGRRSPIEAHGMPRRDVYVDACRQRDRELEPDAFMLPLHVTQPSEVREPAHDDPSYRSGFWGFVEVPHVTATHRAAARLNARLADGSAVAADLGTIELRPGLEWDPLRVADPGGEGPLVAIAMATFNPELEQFRRQIDSIREQSHRRWVCVVSDDDSREEVQRRMSEMLADDPRFVFAPAHRRLGFFHNFERALALIPAEADYVALSDQDDRWYPDKLEALLGAIGSNQLVYGDMRITDDAGTVLSSTFWDHRPNNFTELDRLLVMNTVTGAASLFRRELLELVLPFPPRIGARSIHDQWIAAVALATGELGFVDRPLHDYVQHGRSVLGHPAGYGATDDGLRARMRELLYGQRRIYFGDLCRLQISGRSLLARCGERMEPAKRASVKRLLELDSPAGLARLAARSLRRRRSSPSFGEERKLLRAVAWPSGVRLLTRTKTGRKAFDASLPADVRDGFEVHLQDPPGVEELRQKTEPLELEVTARAPARVNVLIPGIDLRGLFAGYIGIFNLARKLTTLGGSVRLVCFERGLAALPAGWRDEVERYSGLAGLFDEVEVAGTPDSDRKLSVSPDDRFIATTWWSAHIAHAASERLGRERFLYLIQDYEPLFYPMGTWHALAEQTYEFPHVALFSTELLRDFFRAQRRGVFSDGDAAGDAASVSFRNAITPVEAPTAEELSRRERRRLLLYARLESYSPRNLFDLGVLALSDLVADGTIDKRWSLYGVGSVGGPARFDLGHGAELVVMPRQDEVGYAELLRKHDLGVSLMHSPHPSLVPLEMASAGMVTVTNSYANKTPAAMAEISSNLITAEPTREGLREGLRQAVAAVDDFSARAEGARVNWNTDWDSALDDVLMRRIEELLGAC